MSSNGQPSDRDVPFWLELARELQAIGQKGSNLTKGYYDRLNYSRLLEIAADIVALKTPLEREQVLETFRVQPGYATAKVDVRAAVISEGRILLVQERRDQRWCMPGGWADVGEYPSEMVAREVLEESGFRVQPYRLVGVFDANRAGRPMDFFHAYKIVFLCRITGGEARLSDETMGVEFFDFDALPPLSENRTSMRHIDEVRMRLADENLPAAFD
jgi:ADP-ribose pyrophosphatase YjhB (NUDIX family)